MNRTKRCKMAAVAAGALGIGMIAAPMAGAVSQPGGAGAAGHVVAHAGKPYPNFKNTLKANTKGWCTNAADVPCDGTGYGTIDIVPSSFSNYGGYAPGVAGPGGAKSYARVSGGGTGSGGSLSGPAGCPVPGNENCSGPYTDWNILPHSGVFPTKTGFTTSVQIYIDAAWASAHPGQVVDWDTALSDNTGAFLRDFVVNMCSSATGGGGFYVGYSNNAGGCVNSGTEITTSGWYTFTEQFSSTGGSLQVVATVSNSANTAVFTQTDATGLAITGVGGPRYGWLPDEDVQGLPLANSSMQQ